jgi:hypothetical protein
MHTMNYREQQRLKAVSIRDAFFKDPGNGMFLKKNRDFVLSDPSLNLWHGIRDDAKDYFRRNHIRWWKSDSDDPTGHLLSSQVACLNHLYPIRQRSDAATATLRSIMPEVQRALIVNDGYVEFEYIGTKQHLQEKSFQRGANCTSVDAVMLGETAQGKRVLFLIEWKYTESYQTECKYVRERAKVYDHLIQQADGPFVSDVVAESLYYEPFYQMMRQTLLGWMFVRHAELQCDACVHVHVIPQANTELKETVTSPTLEGKDIHSAWRAILKDPAAYQAIDPVRLLQATKTITDTRSWLNYLQDRYWA